MPAESRPLTVWVHFYDNDPAKPFTQWTDYMLKTADLAQKAVKVSYNNSPRRTYAVGTSNGGYQVRRAMEEAPNLFDGGVDWEGTYINPYGPNILIDLPPAIRNFPDYVASNYDPNSQAAQNILAAGYPPDIVNRAVTPVDSLWGRYNAQFWEVTACQWQKRFDPTYPTYTAGLGNYDYLARITVPGVFVDVAATRDHREDQEALGYGGGHHGRPVAGQDPGACLRGGGRCLAQGQQ